jgi:hypothetical protein
MNPMKKYALLAMVVVVLLVGCIVPGYWLTTIEWQKVVSATK